ncbi:MAG: PAS domain S-box protein, partial [Gammaproteobacteria bacterium]|nr:PAS domain S-box protein [Gammaproteobacteria bacterium]
MKKSIQKLEYELANAKARIAELEAVPNVTAEDLIFHSQILQNMSEGVYLVSALDSTIVYSNSVFNKMFGYQSGELIGKHVSIVNAPDIEPEKIVKQIEADIQNTGQWQGETKNIKKDGRIFWCYAKVIAYESPQFGSVYISVHQDITEQKLIENELANQKEFDSRLIETAQVIILVLDTGGRIVSFNPYMENLTGYTQDEVTGKDWFSTFLPGRDQHAIRELFIESIHDIKISGNINPILAKDGYEICIEWYNSTIKDQSGNTLGVLAIGHDISEKRKTQKELQATYQRLDEIQMAMNLVGIAIHIVDPLDGHFIYINNAACKMLGYSREEMLSMGVP